MTLLFIMWVSCFIVAFLAEEPLMAGVGIVVLGYWFLCLAF